MKTGKFNHEKYISELATMKLPNQKKIVGGMFGLELLHQGPDSEIGLDAPFLSSPKLLLATARSAFNLLARVLKPKTVWLPSYLCASVIASFPPDIEIRFYSINESLRIAEKKWLSEIQENDIVVFIDYFGFNYWLEWGQEARQRGAWVIEDACQAMLNREFCQCSHYVLFSPRKFVGVPDGGILLAQNGAKLPDEMIPAAPARWWLEALRASILRAEYDWHGGERTWFDLFQKTEAEGPSNPCKMSELSLMILKEVVDWQEVSIRRRNNYKLLASELEEIAIFPDLTEDAVPLGFPIVVKDRDRIRQALFTEEIFPPIHWPIASFVPCDFEDSHRLAGNIMTIPCDQRYNRSDMERVINILRREAGI